MFEKIRNWKGRDWLLALLTTLVGLLGADKGLEYASAGPDPNHPPRTENPAPDEPEAGPDMFVVLASFYTSSGGGAFPAGRDYIGAYTFEVLKPRPDLILSAFLEKYGEVYPDAEVGRIHTLKIPDKGEPEPDDPEEK